MFPRAPPNNLHISIANFILKVFTFTWSPVGPDCPAIHYNILASNCGSCPTTTTHTNVTCTDVPINGSMCTFAVQSVVCGNIPGNSSDLITVTTLTTEEISIPVNTIGEEQYYYYNNYSMTLHTSAVTYSVLGKKNEATFISSILLATLFITWVTISTLIIIILKFKIEYKQVMINEGLTSTNSSCNVKSKTVIDTSDNVAYGMFTRGRYCS